MIKKYLLFCFLLFPYTLIAQNEYRFSGIYLGNNSNGLSTFKLDIEVLQNGKYKWLHKCNIITGSNLELAIINSDTNYAVSKWEDLMLDTEIKELYSHFMSTYLQRIQSIDSSTMNTIENKTNNTITFDKAINILTVQVRGVQNDKRIWVDIYSLNNQYFIMYNKPILAYSSNLIDISTIRLKPANYIVKVTPNIGEPFSGKVNINE